MKRKSFSGIYIVTDCSLRADRGHLEIAKAAIAGGAGCVQLRGKDQSGRELLKLAEEIRGLTLLGRTWFIVNDRIDVAFFSGADGVHIGQKDLPLRAARAVLGPDAIIGVSTATVEESVEAEAEGADYLWVGPVFPTGTKADAGEAIGLRTLAKIRQAVEIPVVAIGGISLVNIAEVARAGADSAAVISAVVCADDMVEATRGLVRQFELGRAKYVEGETVDAS